MSITLQPELDEDAINEKIGRAMAQLQRGEGIPGDDLSDRLEKRKADWLDAQKR